MLIKFWLCWVYGTWPGTWPSARAKRHSLDAHSKLQKLQSFHSHKRPVRSRALDPSRCTSVCRTLGHLLQVVSSKEINYSPSPRVPAPSLLVESSRLKQVQHEFKMQISVKWILGKWLFATPLCASRRLTGPYPDLFSRIKAEKGIASDALAANDGLPV